MGRLAVSAILVLAGCGDTASPAGLVSDDQGVVLVTIREVGDGTDPDGYQVQIGGTNRSLMSGSPTAFTLPDGAYQISVSEVAPHCLVADENARARVSKSDTSRVVLGVRCVGRYAYESYTDEANELRYMDEAGQSTLLTVDLTRKREFAWSPDGEWLAFTKQTGDNIDIYAIRPDGSGERRLTSSPGVDVSPNWSPDGRSVAFLSVDARNVIALSIADLDGSEVRTVTDRPTSTRFGSEPIWLPSGDEILFVGPEERYGQEVWAVAPDGSGSRKIPVGTRSAGWLASSTDGDRFAAAVWEEGVWEIAVAQVDGSEFDIVAASKTVASPAWSPDGSLVAFSAHDGTDYGIYVVPSSGGETVHVSEGHPTGHYPSFAGDGSYILFQGAQGPVGAVMAVNPDGSGLQTLTPPDALELHPLPRPTTAGLRP